MNYATLRQVRRYPGFGDSSTGDDDLLAFFLNGASRFLEDNEKNPAKVWFEPRRETRLYDVPNDSELCVGHDLLEVETLLNGDGSTISSSAYNLYPPSKYPKNEIHIKLSSGVYWQLPTSGDEEQVISLTGIFGYHNRYASAWVDSLDTVTNVGGINTSTLSFAVSDADGAAGDLDTPRFQVGQLIRMESEYRLVLTVDTVTNTVTATRGENGTVAASHAAGTAIGIFRPMADITMAAIRLTMWRYRQKDVNSFDRTTILQTGIAITPSAVPPDVLALIPRVGGLVGGG